MDEERRRVCLAPLQLPEESLSSVETRLIELVSSGPLGFLDERSDGEGSETSEEVNLFVSNGITQLTWKHVHLSQYSLFTTKRRLLSL